MNLNIMKYILLLLLISNICFGYLFYPDNATFNYIDDLETKSSVMLFTNPNGARIIGMGLAFTGIADDINTLSINPAGLGEIRNLQFSAGYQRNSMSGLESIDQIGTNSLSAVIPLSIGTIGFSNLFLVDVSSITETSPEPVGKLLWYQNGLNIGYGYKINDNISLGFSIKAYFDIPKTDPPIRKYSYAIGFAEDFGFLYTNLSENFKIGMSLLNSGIENYLYTSSNTLSQMPQNLRIGTSYKFYIDKRSKLLIALDSYTYDIFSKRSILKYRVRSNFGLEYVFLNMFSLRIGMTKFRPGSDKTDTAVKIVKDRELFRFFSINTGFGINYSIYYFDTALILTGSESGYKEFSLMISIKL